MNTGADLLQDGRAAIDGGRVGVVHGLADRGEGRALRDVLAERHTVAEGVPSAAAVVDLAGRLEVEMPIAVAVDRVLNHGADIDSTIADLLARPFRSEAHNI